MGIDKPLYWSVSAKDEEQALDLYWKVHDVLSTVVSIALGLLHGARQNPEIFKAYVDAEKAAGGHTMFMKNGKKISIEEHVGIKVSDLSLPVRVIT